MRELEDFVGGIFLGILIIFGLAFVGSLIASLVGLGGMLFGAAWGASVASEAGIAFGGMLFVALFFGAMLS